MMIGSVQGILIFAAGYVSGRIAVKKEHGID
jgi:hypothetical protein